MKNTIMKRAEILSISKINDMSTIKILSIPKYHQYVNNRNIKYLKVSKIRQPLKTNYRLVLQYLMPKNTILEPTIHLEDPYKIR